MRKPRILVRLLGRASVCIDGEEVLQGLPAKTRELFCYLVLYRSKQHRRESLANLLWADHPPELSKKYLRQSLWRLHEIFTHRGVSGPAIVVSGHEWVKFEGSGQIWIDLAEFEAAPNVSLAPAAEQGGDSNFRRLARVEEIYRGDLFEGCLSEWCSSERERFRQHYLSLLDTLISYCERQRLLAEGLDYAMRSLTVDGARESTYRAAMRLLWASGDRTSALRFYDRCAAAILKEFGVSPETETESLIREIKSGVSATAGMKRTPSDRSAGSRIFRRRRDVP